MKLALAYSTKDRVELTRRTHPRVIGAKYDLFWCDGSKDESALDFFRSAPTVGNVKRFDGVRGGADAAIVFALSEMLKHPGYTHVGLLENDVLLPENWYQQVKDLFDAGEREGLAVGAVSCRTYEDRILIQRDGYAVLHNAGAGHIVFTRRAAQLVLDYYRTGWWADNRATFSQLSGIDIGEYGAFRTYDTPITADWHYDTILAKHGFATLGATPSSVEMIGQDPPLEEQGLKIATAPVKERENFEAFDRFRARTKLIRDGKLTLGLKPWLSQRDQNGIRNYIYFPHQFDRLGASVGSEWQMKWSQGYGPFSLVASEDGATFKVPVYGPCCLLMSGGENGAGVHVADLATGWQAQPVMHAEQGMQNIMMIQIPGGFRYRDIHVVATAGARLFALQTVDEQPWNERRWFEYSQLPKVYG